MTKYLVQPAVLKLHIKTVHVGLRDKECNLCGRTFGQTGTRQLHMRTVHDGVRDKERPDCEKSFAQSAQ